MLGVPRGGGEPPPEQLLEEARAPPREGGGRPLHAPGERGDRRASPGGNRPRRASTEGLRARAASAASQRASARSRGVAASRARIRAADSPGDAAARFDPPGSSFATRNTRNAAATTSRAARQGMSMAGLLPWRRARGHLPGPPSAGTIEPQRATYAIPTPHAARRPGAAHPAAPGDGRGGHVLVRRRERRHPLHEQAGPGRPVQALLAVEGRALQEAVAGVGGDAERQIGGQLHALRHVDPAGRDALPDPGGAGPRRHQGRERLRPARALAGRRHGADAAHARDGAAHAGARHRRSAREHLRRGALPPGARERVQRGPRAHDRRATTRARAPCRNTGASRRTRRRRTTSRACSPSTGGTDRRATWWSPRRASKNPGKLP